MNLSESVRKNALRILTTLCSVLFSPFVVVAFLVFLVEHLFKSGRSAKLEVAILSILYEHKELYGLQILCLLEQMPDSRQILGSIHFSDLYPKLHRMENQGLLESRWKLVESTNEGPGRQRRHYRITNSGIRRFNQRRFQQAEQATGFEENGQLAMEAYREV